MAGLLTAISSQFNRSIILGAFLPSTVFVLLFQILIVPMMPLDWQLFRPLEALDTQWKVVAATIIAIVLSGLLYNLNSPIVRFFEGYPWKDSYLGRWRVRRYQSLYDFIKTRRAGYLTLLKALDNNRSLDSLGAYDSINDRWNRFNVVANTELPSRRNLILPTRFGNVMRSSEDYPDHQYGMEAITIWPRLVALVDKDFAAMIDEARTSMDFMLNCCVFSAVLSTTILVTGLVYPIPLASEFWLGIWLCEVALFGLLSYLFYLASISRAGAFGGLVRSAFDLYRWDLLKKLGHERIPRDAAEEREIWTTVYQQMIYGDNPSRRSAEYSPSNPVVIADGAVGRIDVNKGITLLDDHGTCTVTIKLHNADHSQVVDNVSVSDNLDPGYEYAFGSALSTTRNIAVSGSNPYRFKLGSMAPGELVTIRYKILPIKKSE